MRRFLLISLSLVLALAGWSAVGAEDGFYVIPSMKVVPQTGQTTSYATGDDGEWHKGVVSPSPRFTDNNNGTVTDNLTKLIWMKNANAFGTKTWAEALTAANGLHDDGINDLKDGSQAGDWRLPNIRELQSLVDYGKYNPALPEVNPFTDVRPTFYWSSSTRTDNTPFAWLVTFYYGYTTFYNKTTSSYYVWCVRGGP